MGGGDQVVYFLFSGTQHCLVKAYHCTLGQDYFMTPTSIWDVLFLKYSISLTDNVY